MSQKIEFIDLKTQYKVLKSSIDARIQTVLDHGQYIMGPEVRELEEKLETYVGVKHCITVSSGTEALLIALMALGVKSGDEVITTPFTYIATVEVIALLGATPVYVDIEKDTCLIDATKLERAITGRTKAIISVSLYGQVADMDGINAIAKRNGDIPVIEDAAQSFGASYKSQKSCGVSKIGCTSFFPSKPLGCYGDGGAIFTNDDDLAKAMQEIRVHGQERRYYHTRIGVGGRMDTLQCAIVLAKLDRFEWEIERRMIVGEEYQKRLMNLDLGSVMLAVRSNRTCIWAQFTVFVEHREAVQKYLDGKGIPTAIHYPLPTNLQPAYMDTASLAHTENSNWASNNVMSLPMSPDLTHKQLDYIVTHLSIAYGVVK
jgi:UDP-2-acetamido-2-deoxy-ribo-hexuluronate aminotransferase